MWNFSFKSFQTHLIKFKKILIVHDKCMQDVDFHPTEHILATGVIDGRLLLHSCTRNAATELHSIKAHDHEHPCRAVRFSLAGDLVFSTSTDKSILAIDVATGKAQARKRSAHDAPISRLAAVSEYVTASGDEEGVLKLWDSRQSDAIATLTPHTEYISDMTVYAAEHALLTTSGDGTLSLIDLRSNKVKHTSEDDADDELLSVAVVKGGKKVVCGTTSGVLNVWSWGYWNDCSDRFPGHPDSVTAIVKYDEDTILTASSDGLIRVLSVQPNKMLGILGEHSDFDIERLAASADKMFLASASHDNTVRVWDLSQLEDEEEEDVEEGEQEADDKAENQGDKAAADSDDSDDDSDSDAGGKKGRNKRKKGEHKISGRKHQEQGNNFFDGLL